MMALDDQDLTIVMQGPVNGAVDISQSVASMRKLFKNARFIWATQEAEIPRDFDSSIFDECVLTADPGPLPAVKFGGQPHNVNRQITTSAAGLAAVTTRYALKLRADAFLTSRNIIDFWAAWANAPDGGRCVGCDRILVSSFYTLNPRYDERIPFHVGDWLHFGLTTDVQRLWGCPQYDAATASFYETTQHACGSLPRERQFRARFATEQWLTLHYLYRGTDFPIGFHNDCSEKIARQFERDLVDNFIVVHPRDIGLRIPKHERIYSSRYANLRNYSYEEWKSLVKARLGEARPLVGFTQWPRTNFQKSLYMIIRRKRTDPLPRRSAAARSALPRVTMSRN